jgi:hypothetical protein
MASILLPTREWTPACGEICAQLTPDDELLVICDSTTDPVTSYSALRAHIDQHASASDVDTAGAVRLLVAGEPDGCSGKANAIACGLEQASPDQHRIIWTDADFAHGEDWLATMKSLGEQHGAVSGVPVFVSDGWAWQFREPVSVVFGSLAICADNGAWGGSVTFTRDHLDLDAFVFDLRQTVSDDGLLREYLDLDRNDADLTATRELVYEVPVAGTLRAVLTRVVRNSRIVYMTDPTSVRRGLVMSIAFVMLSVVSPLFAASSATFGAWLVYKYLGVDRWTWLLAWPSFLVSPLGTVVGMVKTEFSWGSRRYRWPAKFDVRVLSSDNTEEQRSEST